MQAVVVQVKIDAKRGDEVEKLLRDFTVPTSKGLAGFLRGTWVRGQQGDRGMSLLLFENEEAAKAAVETIRQGPPAGAPVTLESVDLYDILAEA